MPRQRRIFSDHCDLTYGVFNIIFRRRKRMGNDRRTYKTSPLRNPTGPMPLIVALPLLGVNPLSSSNTISLERCEYCRFSSR